MAGLLVLIGMHKALVQGWSKEQNLDFAVVGLVGYRHDVALMGVQRH